MQYILLDIGYQEVCNGQVLRYTDLDGNTINLPAGYGGRVIDANPTTPAWAIPDPEEQPASVEALPRSVSKVAFRRLFTDVERPLIDEFNAVFESLPYLTAEQKRAIRSGLEDYKAAKDEVNRDDLSTQQMLNLYVAVGLLQPSRVAEILNA